jgi:UDP-glucose 4-epimerase
MKVLVTGAAGFIGSHLCDLLIKKKDIKKIILIDHLEDGSKKNIRELLNLKKVFFYQKDIRNLHSIKKLFKNIDCVYHLAALSDVVPSIINPKDYFETNVNGTLNILECMRSHKVKKIIYAASSSCYGIPKKYPTKEDEMVSPKYPYAFSKLEGENLILHWSKVYGINFISLRLFNVYGTRSRTHGAYGAALGVFLKQKIKNKPFTVVGNGRQKRDFIYVTDVSNAFYLASKSKVKNQIFNVGYGKPNSVNYLLKLIGGKKIHIPKRPGEPFITHADTSKIKKLLHWNPKISFESGVKKVIDDIAYWKFAPLWTSSKIKKATKLWFKYLK